MITPSHLYLINDAKDTLVYTRSSEWASPYVWSDVRGKSWEETNIGAGLRRSYTFTDSLLIDSLFYSGDRKPTVSKSLYYLQDTVPAKFDTAKVGKPTYHQTEKWTADLHRNKISRWRRPFHNGRGG